MNPAQDQIRAAYRNLPVPVRAYLASTKLYDLTQDLGKTYSIHVDTLGVIAQSITSMLLGLESPLQFQTELAGLGVQDTVADSIIQEINEKVFKALREEIRNAPREEALQEEPASVPIPTHKTPEPVINVPQPIVAPIAPPAPKPAPPPPAVFAAPHIETPSPVAEPLIQKPATAPSTPTPAAPVPPVPSRSIQPPQSTTPPISQPRQPISPPTLTPRPAAPASVSGRDELHSVLKKYGVDPYREIPE